MAEEMMPFIVTPSSSFILQIPKLHQITVPHLTKVDTLSNSHHVPALIPHQEKYLSPLNLDKMIIPQPSLHSRKKTCLSIYAQD
jgi:hypothetical protein